MSDRKAWRKAYYEADREKSKRYYEKNKNSKKFKEKRKISQ